MSAKCEYTILGVSGTLCLSCGPDRAGSGVLEYRIDWGPGYRVYFGRDGDILVILLSGGTKKRQQRDIETAKELWIDYKARRLRI
jgi:putative addiction module killer protein